MSRGHGLSFKAILIGCIVDLSGSVTLGSSVYGVVAILNSFKGISLEATKAALMASNWYLLTALVVGLFCDGLGGYAAVIVAPTEGLGNALGVGVCALLAGIATTVFGRLGVPPWFSLISWTFGIPCSLLGGHFRLAKEKRRQGVA